MTVICGIMILQTQNLIRLAPHCNRCTIDYTGIHGLKIKCPHGALDFLRTWYNERIATNAVICTTAARLLADGCDVVQMTM